MEGSAGGKVMSYEAFKASCEASMARIRKDRASAVEGLEHIAAGTTFHSATGDNPMRDVTAERKADLERIVRRSDELLAAYEKQIALANPREQ